MAVGRGTNIRLVAARLPPRRFCAWRGCRDDDRAGFQFGCQDLADIGGEGRSVHRALDHPRRNQGICRQPRDECLRAPVAERRIHVQPASTQSATTQSGEVGFDGSFIDEDQAFRLPAHRGYSALQPIKPRASDRGAAAFGRHQRLFLYVKPRFRSKFAGRRMMHLHAFGFGQGVT